MELLDTDYPTAFKESKAKDALDKLHTRDADFVIVLNKDSTVAGIITRTSMTNALASVVWGEDN